ncbi:uncharacterized protein EHS24_007640 [Apiotrichum porosum]|uniref:Uncharacterized protein n=1 Tax=Apiotrichum porosum TaxID=105984 RepID=A0A427XV14_9TREE|nr:uncharacterized protein EHS24_007640 [Apiotrichum porosum]RSH82647.1 hypothetical protein EHS24_007640 [Apiotrichum porosum]
MGGPPRRQPVFPAPVRRFPRSNWDGVLFSFHPIPRGMLDAKARVAARAASQRWQAAFDTDDIGTLDAVDFAVAVFDVASHMKDHMPAVMKQLGRRVATPDAWRTLTDELIRRAFSIACKAVSARFPAFELPTLADVRLFARGAMDSVWKEGIDSWGMLHRHGYDETRFTDQYMPDPVSLPPRAFTVVSYDLEDDPLAEDKKLVWFIDADGKIVEECLGRDLPRPVTPPLAHTAKQQQPTPTVDVQTSPHTTSSSPSLSSNSASLPSDEDIASPTPFQHQSPLSPPHLYR